MPTDINHTTSMVTLHKLAVAHRPEVPKKNKSTWVAVLYHTTKDTSQITEKHNFMWIKCHGRITVKTLKYQYFSRHPLADGFVLKQGKKQLSDLSEVKHLLLRSVFDDGIVVLRALEKQQAELEEYQEDEEDLQRRVKDVSAIKANGIVTIDSDDEDELSGPTTAPKETHDIEAQGKDRSSAPSCGPGTPLDEGRLPTPDTDNESRRSMGVVTNGRRRSAAVITIDSDDEDEVSAMDETEVTGSNQAETVAPPLQNDLEPSALIIHAATRDEEIENIPAARQSKSSSTPEDEDPSDDEDESFFRAMRYASTTDLIARMDALPEPQRSIAYSTNDHLCEACSEPMYMREWTHFGPAYGPLCVECTKIWLRHTGDLASLELVEHMLEEEYITKRVYQDKGISQDLDDNAAVNYPEVVEAEAAPNAFYDPLQAAAWEDYQMEWPQGSGGSSPGMFEGAKNVSVATTPAYDYKDFLAADDEDLVAAADDGVDSDGESVDQEVKFMTKHATENEQDDWMEDYIDDKKMGDDPQNDEDYNAGDESEGDDD